VISRYVEIRFLNGKNDENMNWHENSVFIDEADFNMHICRNFGRRREEYLLK
jgi:hypothetical protein